MLLKTDSIRWRSFFPLLQILGEAVAYRIPRPVVRYIRYHSGNTYPVCPRCKCSLEREYAGFCDRCGQRLGWSAMHHAEVIGPVQANPWQTSEEAPAAISDIQHPEHINWRSRLGQDSIGN